MKNSGNTFLDSFYKPRRKSPNSVFLEAKQALPADSNTSNNSAKTPTAATPTAATPPPPNYRPSPPKVSKQPIEVPETIEWSDMMISKSATPELWEQYAERIRNGETAPRGGMVAPNKVLKSAPGGLYLGGNSKKEKKNNAPKGRPLDLEDERRLKEMESQVKLRGATGSNLDHLKPAVGLIRNIDPATGLPFPKEGRMPNKGLEIRTPTGGMVIGSETAKNLNPNGLPVNPGYKAPPEYWAKSGAGWTKEAFDAMNAVNKFRADLEHQEALRKSGGVKVGVDEYGNPKYAMPAGARIAAYDGKGNPIYGVPASEVKKQSSTKGNTQIRNTGPENIGRPPAQSGYGSRIGLPPNAIVTMDFIDRDRDGTDDRYQTGPGKSKGGTPPTFRPPPPLSSNSKPIFASEPNAFPPIPKELQNAPSKLVNGQWLALAPNSLPTLDLKKVEKQRGKEAEKNIINNPNDTTFRMIDGRVVAMAGKAGDKQKATHGWAGKWDGSPAMFGSQVTFPKITIPDDVMDAANAADPNYIKQSERRRLASTGMR